jgi:urea transport system substrate-binding protein
MNSASLSRGTMLVMLVLQLSLVDIRAARAGEETIKIGILDSLSGTMAISEAVLKDTGLMLIEDQNKKGGLLGRNWNR